jgi:hypothetical protein
MVSLGAGTSISSPGSNVLTFGTNSTEKVRITSDGKVGIGTDMVSGALSNYGFAVYRASGTGYLYTETGGSSQSAGFRAKAGTADFTIYTTEGTGQLAVYDNTNNAQRLKLDSSGKLKLGSNTLVTPDANADNLVIDTGDVDSGISILSATTGRIYFGDAADDEAGSIRYVHTDNSMRFETNSGERLRITSVGDVLLGGLTSKNDGRNAKGITLKSPAGISFQNFGANGSRNWRIRPDDLSSWGSLDFSVNSTDDNNTDWPDASTDVVLELKKNKDVKIHDGNLIIGTSGHGIDFSVTGNGGTGTPSELLDDYEEGFFTPTIYQGADNGSGGAPTFAIQAGRYIKIGRKVHCDIYIRFASSDRSTGAQARIGNLPFAIANESYGNVGAGNLTRGGGVNTYQDTTQDVTTCYGSANATNFYLYKNGGTGFVFGGSNDANLSGKYWIGIFEYICTP